MALGDLEREVMTQLWNAGEPLTVRRVHESLSRDRDLAYTTVMTVLDRLAKKGVVTQQRADRAYRYAPAQTREEMTAALMLDALSAAPDGVRDAALAHFVGRLDPSALTAAIEAARTVPASAEGSPTAEDRRPR
jgi:predicted transcriptional regulator